MSTNPSPARRASRAARCALALTIAVGFAAALSLGGCAKPATTPTPPAAVAPGATATAPASAPGQPSTSAVEPTTTALATTTPAAVPQAAVRVYLVRDEFLGVGAARMVPATTPAAGAMRALLVGPTYAEKVWGLHTEIPSGTKLRSVRIADGVATVDLSKRFESGGGTLGMTLRIAQVVDTLTQFKGVKAVAFRIGGKPVSSIGGEGIMVSPPVNRDSFPDALPAIMVESPLPGATVRSPMSLRGSADVFEAQFTIRVTDAAGKIVAERPVKASRGTGTRGTFSALAPFKATKHGKGWIMVFQMSGTSGTPTDIVKIRVTL